MGELYTSVRKKIFKQEILFETFAAITLLSVQFITFEITSFFAFLAYCFSLYLFRKNRLIRFFLRTSLLIFLLASDQMGVGLFLFLYTAALVPGIIPSPKWATLLPTISIPYILFLIGENWLLGIVPLSVYWTYLSKHQRETTAKKGDQPAYRGFPILFFDIDFKRDLNPVRANLPDDIVNFTGLTPDDILKNPLRLLAQLPHPVWDKESNISSQEFYTTTPTGKKWIRSYVTYQEGTQGLKKVSGFLLNVDQSMKNLIDIETKLEITEKAIRNKENLFNNMTHLFRSPLHSIWGMSDLLIKSNIEPEKKEWAHAIRTDSESLIDRVNELVNYDRIINHNLKLESFHFPLSDIIDFIEEWIKKQSGENKIEFTIKKPFPKLVVGDKELIIQMIRCLLKNSVLYGEKSDIKIKLDWELIEDQEGTLRIIIEDKGPGFPLEILEAFNQKKPILKDTRKLKTLCLGLIISKQISEAMNGRLFIENKNPKGASSFLEIPTYFPKGVTTENEAIMSNQIKVLLAEDNKVNQNVQMRMLQKIGCLTQVVNNGKEALEAIEKESFDIIFMDCQMPILDGIEATREIRKRETSFHLPIIALTGYAMPGDHDNFLQAGMDDVLSKPIKTEDFKEALGKWTGYKEEVIKTEKGEDTSIKLFNLSKALELLGNDSTILKPVIETYLEDIPEQIQNLHSAINSGDFLKSRKINHSIIGASTAVSADKLLKHLETLRNFLANENQEAASREAGVIETIFNQTIKRLESYINT